MIDGEPIPVIPECFSHIISNPEYVENQQATYQYPDQESQVNGSIMYKPPTPLNKKML